jgi:hypothetical protein
MDHAINIQKRLLMENPNKAIAVSATLNAVTFPAPNFLRSLSLKKLEIIVPPEITVETIPA